MKVYVLSIYSIHPLTQEDLETSLKIHNLRYKRETTMEDFLKFKEDWVKGSSKYDIDYSSGEKNAYFYNLGDAIYAVQRNMGDINEAGVYNYATILAYEVGQMYATCQPLEFYAYKYNRTIDGYEEIHKGEDEVYDMLVTICSASHLEASKPVIELDLSKKEISQNQDFVNELKTNFDNKDYTKVKQMIESKEVEVSNSFNNFLDEVSESFKPVDDALNKFFDVLNGKF
jgi:hypothetical protein